MDQIIGNISVLIAAPIFNLGLLIDGLLIGAIFALAAYGLALVWGVMNVKNLAQGDFIMIGGYLTWSLGNWGIHPLFGVPLAFVAGCSIARLSAKSSPAICSLPCSQRLVLRS
jgi:branched-chain amino acid transport system permease protein